MIDVRIARRSDARGIAEVHVRSWRHAYTGLLPDTYLDSLRIEEREKQWEATIESVSAFSTDKMILVAEDTRTRQVIGFVHVGAVREPDGVHDSEVYALYILDGWHRQGVGKSLMSQALEWLQARGYRAAKLWVIDHPPLREFHRRMGATLTHDIQDAEIGGQKVTKISYSFELERWGRARDLQRARWIVALGCLPAGAFAEGFTHLLGIREHVMGYRTELFDVLNTLPSQLTLPLIWLVLTYLASPRSALGVESYHYWRQGGYATLIITYLAQILLRTSFVTEFTHPDVMTYFYPGILVVAWVILALYAYLIRLLFRRSLYE